MVTFELNREFSKTDKQYIAQIQGVELRLYVALYNEPKSSYFVVEIYMDKAGRPIVIYFNQIEITVLCCTIPAMVKLVEKDLLNLLL